MIWDEILEPIRQIYELGGPVVLVLLFVSIVTAALVLYKIWQFHAARLGRHKALREAVHYWDLGARAQSRAALGKSKSTFARLIGLAMQAEGNENLMPRLEAEAGAKFLSLERGLRFFDSVAQLAPLLGLFGTVIGMIEAFRALQQAGSQVDPSILAGGIWVALLTTAAGLAVAMPTALLLSWLEARLERERVFVEEALTRILSPRKKPGPYVPVKNYGT